MWRQRKTGHCVAVSPKASLASCHSTSRAQVSSLDQRYPAPRAQLLHAWDVTCCDSELQDLPNSREWDAVSLQCNSSPVSPRTPSPNLPSGYAAEELSQDIQS